MGNAQSTGAAGGGPAAPDLGDTKYGYHVLLVQHASPAEEAGLEAYFDFLVEINGHRLDKDDNTLLEQLKAHVNRPVPTTVYSSKTERLRQITLVPSNNWGGVGLIGARVRFCDFENANEHVWHILDVQPNSPAERAGLQAHDDYVIASPETLLHDQGAFAEHVQQSMHKPMRLYVYNRATDTIREVTVIPDRDWGGTGSLGCDVGYGHLHRIPRPDVAAIERRHTSLPSSGRVPAAADLAPSPMNATVTADAAAAAPAAASGPAPATETAAAAPAAPSREPATVPAPAAPEVASPSPPVTATQA